MADSHFIVVSRYVQRKNNPHSVQYVPVLDGKSGISWLRLLLHDCCILRLAFFLSQAVASKPRSTIQDAMTLLLLSRWLDASYVIPKLLKAQIWLTHHFAQLFERFNPTADERRDGLLYGGLTWDLYVNPSLEHFDRRSSDYRLCSLSPSAVTASMAPILKTPRSREMLQRGRLLPYFDFCGISFRHSLHFSFVL
jgi:hypothetical protein